MFLSLPSDISLHIFSYLSLNDLCRIELVSRAARSLFLAHQEAIYHQAAIYHRLVKSRTPLEDAAAAGGSWLSDTRDWKEFCRRWCVLEGNWDGHGYVHEGGYPSAGKGTVLGFVIDKQQNTSITLTRKGGLEVWALEDNRLLWALGKDYVGTNLFDFSQGFLVFMAKHFGLEIWRRVADIQIDSPAVYSRGRPVITPVHFPSPAAARDFQAQAATLAPVQKDSHRGHFVPHAYLDTSSDAGAVRLFRIHFPLLAYIGFGAPNTVAVIDIGSGETVWKLSVGTGRVLGMPQRFRFPPLSECVSTGLELSDKHLCICMYDVVVIYRLPVHCTSKDAVLDSDKLEAKADMVVLGEMDTPPARRTTACLLKHSPSSACGDTVSKSTSRSTLPVMATVRGQDAFERFAIISPSEDAQQRNMQALVPAHESRTRPTFVCTRFSPDGKHLAAVTAFGLLYFAWDFARAETGVLFADFTEYLNVGEPLLDLCWDAQLRRVAVRTTWEDVFVVTFDKSYHALRATDGNAQLATSPTIMHHATAMRLRDFSNHALVGWARVQGVAFNGIQMTRTALWLVWDVGLLAGAVAKREPEADGKRTLDGRRNETAIGSGSVCFVDFTPRV